MHWLRLLNNNNSNNNNDYLKVSKWLASLGVTKFSKPIEEMSKEELNASFTCFYTSARMKDGIYYKTSSMNSIRTELAAVAIDSGELGRFKFP